MAPGWQRRDAAAGNRPGRPSPTTLLGSVPIEIPGCQRILVTVQLPGHHRSIDFHLWSLQVGQLLLCQMFRPPTIRHVEQDQRILFTQVNLSVNMWSIGLFVRMSTVTLPAVTVPHTRCTSIRYWPVNPRGQTYVSV